nr:DAK2 domain-containing protein [Lachnospiraceae bacterium]
MAIRRINGIELERMLRSGLANLQQHEEEINRLNVFPVPDGDTGTNMCMTLAHGLQNAVSTTQINDFLKTLSAGMLLGARGNSGVILSQFFYGFSQELSRSVLIGPGELRSGLIRGYRMAYDAVLQPVEGTMLSVAREGIEHIRAQITRSSGIDVILSMYIAEMRRTLAQTPEMLPVLKDAGVVDSGGAGFILIFEGMLKYLHGEPVESAEPAVRETAAPSPSEPDLSLFDENSTFADGYCVDYLLQLMNGGSYDQHFRLQNYIDRLQKYGNSIVCVQNDKRVKVHVHTKTPAYIIQLSQKYGEFLTFKLENMQIQHNEHDRETQQVKNKPLSVVAVVNGNGMASLFASLGADKVIDGGATMNTSAQEFVAAFEQLPADEIVVLPNSKNIILAAEQAAGLFKAKHVTVIPTASYAEGYFALAMDMPDSSDVSRRIQQMLRGAKDVVTVSETTASRDWSYHEIRCRKGEEIAFLGGELVCVNSDWKAALIDALLMIDGAEDKETGVVFRGSGVSEEQEAALAEAVAEKLPLLELEFIDAGQEIYHWVLGVM